MSDQNPQPTPLRPEELPQGLVPRKSFMFTTKLLEEQKRENQALIDSYQGRVDKICEALTMNNTPVIPALLHVTSEKDVLKRLAKGIDRVADLVEVLDELKTRQKVLEYAEQDPVWFAAAFADLEHEVSSSIPDDVDIEALLSQQ